MPSFYLSPRVPRWSPKTEEDIRAAMDERLFDENRSVELKAMIPPARDRKGKDNNLELARDLAQFAVDGGILIVGIGESRESGELVHKAMPVEAPDRLADRIDQVARSKVDPPLYVDIDCISAELGGGYLVITIPPSPLAPHMVDGQYWGRAATGKTTLSDGDVRRLHQERQSVEDAVSKLLDWQVARDPVPADLRTTAHMHLVAKPLAGRPRVARHVVDEAGWQQRLGAIVNETAHGVVQALPRWVDSLPATDLQRAAHSSEQHRRMGAAALSSRLTASRGIPADTEPRQDYDRRVNDLEFTDDGEVRFFTGNLSGHAPSNFVGFDLQAEYLIDRGALLNVRHFLGVVAAFAELIPYSGAWGLGVTCTGIRNLTSATNRSPGGWPNNAASDQDTYTAVTTATAAGLVRAPGALTDQLVGRLIRAVDTWSTHAAAFTDPEVEGDERSMHIRTEDADVSG